MSNDDLILELSDIVQRHYDMSDMYTPFDSMECASDVVDFLIEVGLKTE